MSGFYDPIVGRVREYDVGFAVLRVWRWPVTPFLSTRYMLLNGGAFGWVFMLMRKYRPAGQDKATHGR